MKGLYKEEIYLIYTMSASKLRQGSHQIVLKDICSYYQFFIAKINIIKLKGFLIVNLWAFQ